MQFDSNGTRGRLWLQGFVCSLLLLGLSPHLKAQEQDAPSDPKFAFFESKIRPLLVEQCFDCHNQDSPESDLAVDSLRGLLEGGLRGAALVRGAPDQSLLMRAVRHGEQLKMPPKTKLASAQIADLAEWISMGAPWPDAEVTDSATTNEAEWNVPSAAREFWSFRPLRDVALPQVKRNEWVKSPIDAFILQPLEAAGIRPAPPANRSQLIRRLTYDLTGLPPTPDEIRTYLEDQLPDATTRLIDRLLSSPRYGERWGRHWLDVARYADSNGLDENLAHANAFQYRDYVVNAFNKDKPFHQFLREQLAGDLLSGEPGCAEWDHPQEGMVATGFLLLGAKMLAEDDPVKMQMDIIDEQIDTMGRAFMGLTLGCARCHDHKFDPIPTSDYYSLAGIFKSTKAMVSYTVVARWQELPITTPEAVKARDAHQLQIDAKADEAKAYRQQESQRILDLAKANVGSYLLAAHALELRQGKVEQATPAGPTYQPGQENSVFVEAEDFQRGNVNRDRTSYGAGIGVLVNAGPTPNFAEYDLEIKRSGLYQLDLRYAALAARPCRVYIDGKLWKSDAAGQVTGSWQPDGQRWFVEDVLPLQEGKHVLRLEQPQFFPHIDKVLLTWCGNFEESTDEPGFADGYQPVQEVVPQWRTYLSGQKESMSALFAPWTALSSGQPYGAESKPGLAWLGADDSQPDRLLDLAALYQEKFREVRESKPESLDELSAVAQQLLTAEDGPFKEPETIENAFSGEARTGLAKLRDEEKALRAGLPQFPHAMAVSEGQIENVPIHIRGSHLTLGKKVPRRFPRVLQLTDDEVLAADRSGRLELANWLTSPSHPLTARVIANRIWLWHFGQGLVRSPDNFGKLGEQPTHPELLDWLALRLIESGWSLKQMHRLLLLSSAYQMSARYNDSAFQVDPDNKLWWRMNRRRLEVEEIHDSILAVSGRIQYSMGGTLLPQKSYEYVTSTANVEPKVYQTTRRAIYLPVVRSALYEVFQAFDFPDPSVLSGARQSTTVASQALFAMNSQFVTESAQALAAGVTEEYSDDEARVRQIYWQVLGRAPTEEDKDRMLRFVSRQRKDRSEDAMREQLVWTACCRVLMATNEFLFVE